MTKILFVEDELGLQKSISYILNKEGFSVITAGTGKEAVQKALQENPDLILLDLMLPDIHGFDVCELLKKNPLTANIFIIMLTGKNLLEDITEGLGRYADDYITKPVEPAILLVRIKAILRRKLKNTDIDNDLRLFRFKDLTIDTAGRDVRFKGEILDLTKSEFDLLLLFARNPNIVFTRAKVLEHIRQDDYELTDRVVDYQVAGLRKKLAPAGQFIETIRGVGYKFKI